MKKKYLAWIFSGVSMNKLLTVNSLLINQLCENFEKIYFINMYKLKLFADSDFPFFKIIYNVNVKITDFKACFTESLSI